MFKIWSGNILNKLVIKYHVLNPISKRYLFKGARYVTDTLWMLMESGIEEVKILQTLTLLLTSSHVVQNETLAKCLVICLRLNFTKGRIFLWFFMTRRLRLWVLTLSQAETIIITVFTFVTFRNWWFVSLKMTLSEERFILI